MYLNALKYLFFQVALLCVIASTAAAQSLPYTISGKVLEKGSRKPLEGIAVYVEGNEAITAITAADGSFILVTGEEGDFSIMAAGMGYEKSPPQNVSFHENDNIENRIYLEPVSALPEIIVEADRNPDKTGKTVISGEELLSVPGSSGDPLRGMQALPGITTSSDYSSNPAIRGSGPEDNAYYVDFLPVGYLFHLGGLVSVINADLVDDFNIYASAFGPEFANVTGAVIDVKLRTPRQDRLGGKVNISLLETDVLVEGPVTNDQYFYLAGRRSYYDLLLSKQGDLDEGVSYTQFPQYYDYQGKYLWRISNDHKLTIQLGGAEDSMELSFTDDADFVKQDPVLAGDLTFERAYHTQGLVLDSRLSGRANNILGLSYMKSLIDRQHDQLGTVKVDIDNAFIRDHLTVGIGSSHNLLTALEYTLTHIDLNLDTVKEVPSDYDPDTDYTSSERFKNDDVIIVNEFALGLKDRWKLLDDLTVIYGGRTAYDDFIGQWMLEPRTSLEYQIMRKTLITAGWGKFHQFPQGYQVIEGLGNPDLGYQKADHYTLGIEQGLPNLFSVKLEGYYKELYDLVIPHEAKNYVNGGSGEAYGAELLLKKDRTAEWWGWLSVAYAETKRKNDLTGEEFAYRYDQPWIVNLVYNWAFRPKWTFGARWRYQSGAPYTPVAGTYTDSSGRVRPVYGELGSKRLPDYHRLDLRLARDFLFNTWKMGFYVDIINAYGHENVSGYQYNEDYSSREPIHQLPFLISIGLKAEF